MDARSVDIFIRISSLQFLVEWLLLVSMVDEVGLHALFEFGEGVHIGVIGWSSI